MNDKNCKVISKVLIGLIVLGGILSILCIILGVVKGNSKMLYVLGILGFCCVGGLAFLESVFLDLMKMDDYDKYLYIIFKIHSAILVDGDYQKDSTIDEIILVKSFKDLLKIQATTSSPIVYKKEDNACTFFIKNPGCEYRCILIRTQENVKNPI